MANNLNVTISPLGASSSSYTLRWRVLGTNVWLTSNITPPNNIASSNLSSVIAVPSDNTIYEVQALDNCGTSVAQGAIARIINRGCPSYTDLNVITTSSTVTGVVPLNTPLPVSNHISTIAVSIFIGFTLVSSQLITAPTSFNPFMFTGLNANTSYGIVLDITYTVADTVSPTYALGDTPILHKCLAYSFTTAAAAICTAPIITGITQS